LAGGPGGGAEDDFLECAGDEFVHLADAHAARKEGLAVVAPVDQRDLVVEQLRLAAHVLGALALLQKLPGQVPVVGPAAACVRLGLGPGGVGVLDVLDPAVITHGEVHGLLLLDLAFCVELAVGLGVELLGLNRFEELQGQVDAEPFKVEVDFGVQALDVGQIQFNQDEAQRDVHVAPLLVVQLVLRLRLNRRLQELGLLYLVVDVHDVIVHGVAPAPLQFMGI